MRILYRGPLSSCNYGCVYCPFAKRKESRAELAHDRACLERFVGWVGARDHAPIGVLVTPWGEALVRRHYQEALVRLTGMAHVERAAIQTNLSGSLGFVDRCDLDKLALWCTWHPEWSSMAAFVASAMRLHRRGVRLSVGVVGFARFAGEIKHLREVLPPEIYVWINAVKDELGSQPEEIAGIFEAIDPLYRINTRRWPSEGRSCRAGATVISVDGNGDARRCHFIPTKIGNIYEEGFEAALRERPCSNATCHCHIGYAHLDYLELDKVFGAGILERVPQGDWREAIIPEGARP